MIDPAVNQQGVGSGRSGNCRTRHLPKNFGAKSFNPLPCFSSLLIRHASLWLLVMASINHMWLTLTYDRYQKRRFAMLNLSGSIIGIPPPAINVPVPSTNFHLPVQSTIRINHSRTRINGYIIKPSSSITMNTPLDHHNQSIMNVLNILNHEWSSSIIRITVTNMITIRCNQHPSATTTNIHHQQKTWPYHPTLSPYHPTYQWYHHPLQPSFSQYHYWLSRSFSDRWSSLWVADELPLNRVWTCFLPLCGLHAAIW